MLIYIPAVCMYRIITTETLVALNYPIGLIDYKQTDLVYIYI